MARKSRDRIGPPAAPILFRVQDVEAAACAVFDCMDPMMGALPKELRPSFVKLVFMIAGEMLAPDPELV